MIVDEVTLHNVGLYRGSQQFILTPRSPTRPIVLVGGQNGGGKTTFLDALQIAFFGKLAQPSVDAGMAYAQFLRRLTNRAASSNEVAYIEVAFRRTVEGREHRYLIRRSWPVGEELPRETFKASIDGQPDQVLSDQWLDFIEDALPPRIAPLFFFDGERIEQFANVSRSAEIVRTAIYALLGLDIVERLSLDLEVFERRKLGGQRSSVDGELLTSLDTGLAAVEARLIEARQERASCQTRVDRALKLQSDAAQTFEAQGGETFRRRHELGAHRADVWSEIGQADDRLRKCAAEVTPLALLQDMLAEIMEQDLAEQHTRNAALVGEALDERDRRLLERLRAQRLPVDILRLLEAELAGSRAESSAPTVDVYLGLSPGGRGVLSRLLNGELAESISFARDFLAERATLERQFDELDRRLASLPSTEDVTPLISALEESEVKLKAAQAELHIASERCLLLEREHSALRVKVRTIIERALHTHQDDDDAARMVRHSLRVRSTLRDFQRRVVSHHITRIEGLVLRNTQKLMRKLSLIAEVKIDPETFQITLKGGDWKDLPPDRLSAGERQLFAISMLWALSQASGRAVPTIIDTPLGRLDSVHRRRLVKGYFPEASHQVVLLSTDEEIDAKLFEQLQPAISRTYSLSYDEQERESRVSDGYLFGIVA